MSEINHPVRLAGAEIRSGCHACAFFHTPEEEYRALLPFATEGFDRGERVFQLVDPGQQPERQRRLAEAGVTEAAARRQGQLEVRAWEGAYLRGGRFDQHAMLTLIQEELDAGKQAGFPITRLWANMEWALEDLPGVHDIVEYESRLNSVLPRYHDVVVCSYDLVRFSATIVMDILRTHPWVLIGGLLQENPFYVPPDKFLDELRTRRDAAVSGRAAPGPAAS